METFCELCGYTPRTDKARAANLYHSSMQGKTLCTDGIACKRRRNRLANPSISNQEN